jgi:hypothetical protein
MSFDHIALAINADIQGAPSMKLALIVLANHMNKKTGLCNPSVAKVAKQLGLGEKQTRILLHRLRDDGYVSIAMNALGGRPGNTPHYKINLEKLKSKTILQINSSSHSLSPLAHFSPTSLVRVSPTTPIRFQDYSRAITQAPPLDESQTKNEPNIKPSLTKIENEYGDRWFESREAVNRLGAQLHCRPLETESVFTYAMRLKELL